MICRYKIKFISDIEQKIRKLLVNIAVAPFVGVWIEISLVNVIYSVCKMSLPSWECGLKCAVSLVLCKRILVAPFVGVWIEIGRKLYARNLTQVAPFVGVWIEIFKTAHYCLVGDVAPFVGVWIEMLCSLKNNNQSNMSLPSWECGLKFK